MIAAEEAHVISEENKIKIDEQRKSTQIKEISDEIRMAINNGRFHISWVPELYDETIEYFTGLGYKVTRYSENNLFQGSKIEW